MTQIFITIPANRDRCGLLRVLDAEGQSLCEPMQVAARATEALAARHGNPDRSPLFPYGDPPTGTYRLLARERSGQGLPVGEYGRVGALIMLPIAGEAALAEANGRYTVGITGGELSGAGLLRSTAGAFRVSDEDLLRLLYVLGSRFGDVLCQCELGEAPDAPAVEVDALCGQLDPISTGEAPRALVRWTPKRAPRGPAGRVRADGSDRLGIFVMHDRLRDAGGHMYTESRGWISICRERGIDVKLFVHRDANPAVVDELGATPLFGETVEDRLRYGPIEGSREQYRERLYRFMMESRQFRRCCSEAWNAAARKPDIVVFSYGHPSIMNGAADWLADLSAAERPKLVFNFPHPERSWVLNPERTDMSGDFDEFRFCTRRMRALVPLDRMLFTAVDRRLAATIGRVAEVDCVPAPLHHAYPSEEELAAWRPISPGPGLKVALLGAPRGEKGGGSIADNVIAITAKRPDARFFIQTKGQADAEDLANQLASAPIRLDVDLQPGALSNEPFFRQMLAADLILLPYTDNSYGARPSGVFSEAVVCGTPVVASANTWVSDRLDEGWGAGETFDTPTPEAIAEAVVRAAKRLPKLKKQAAASSAGWRKTQSLEAYIDHMLARLGLGPLSGTRSFATLPVMSADGTTTDAPSTWTRAVSKTTA